MTTSVSSGEIDWGWVICRLRAKGITHRNLATLLKCSRRTVINYQRNDTEPRYSEGRYILDLYTSVYGTTRHD